MQEISELVLVRHGETVGQSSIRLYGATDLELSDVGERQVRAAGSALIGERFDAVLTSPLCRAKRSAELVLDAMGAVAVSVARPVDDFREIDFGTWEGWTVQEVESRDPAGHRRWKSEGERFGFPNGEGRADFRARVVRAVREHIDAPCRARPARILGVLHKGVIKLIVGQLTGLERERAAALRVNLGSIHRLKLRGDRWVLVEPNRVDHLSAELLQANS